MHWSEFPVGCSVSLCFPRIPPNVSDLQHCLDTFLYSIMNWKRGWLSYLPAVSEQLVSGRRSQGWGVGLGRPGRLGRHAGKWLRWTISVHRLHAAYKHTALAPDLPGLAC